MQFCEPADYGSVPFTHKALKNSESFRRIRNCISSTPHPYVFFHKSQFVHRIRLFILRWDAASPLVGEKRKRLFCIHPHGIYTLGALALPDHLPEVRLCCLAVTN